MRPNPGTSHKYKSDDLILFIIYVAWRVILAALGRNELAKNYVWAGRMFELSALLILPPARFFHKAE